MTWKWNDLVCKWKCFQQKKEKTWKDFYSKSTWFVVTRGELDLKMLSSIATIVCDTLVRMTFNNFWGWDLKIKLFADTLCLDIKKSDYYSIHTNMQKIFEENKMKKVNQSFVYNAFPVGLWCLITFPTVLKSVLACIEVDSESLPTRFGPSE
jgi:hypothetical protein